MLDHQKTWIDWDNPYEIAGKTAAAGAAATATAATLEEAIAKAYTGMETIKFDGMHFRKDIGQRAFEQKRKRRISDAPLTYASAGVSIDAGNSLVKRIKAAVKSTARAGADADIGGFGGGIDLVQNFNGTPLIYIGGVASGPSNWSIDSNGIITFNSAPALGSVLTWSGSFYFRCRFDEDSLSGLKKFAPGLWDDPKVKFVSLITG